GPVLEVIGADVAESAEFAGAGQLIGEGDSGDAAVAVPDGGEGFFVLAGGIPHLAGIIQRAGEGFFAGDVFAGFEGGDGHFGVGVVGAGDIDEIDFGVGD